MPPGWSTNRPSRALLVAGLGAASLVPELGCRPEAGDEARAPTVDPAAEGGEAESAPEPTARERYRMAWLADTGAVNRAVAVAPAGWVVSVNQEELRVHAPDTGKVLESDGQCPGPDEGLFFVEEQKALLVCARELREVRFPGLEWRRISELDFDAVHVDVAGGLLVVSDGKFKVQVRETTAWQKLADFTLEEQVVDVELSEDGRVLAVGGELGTTFIHDMGAQTTEPLTTSDRKPTALAFSPRRDLLFLHDATLSARLLDRSTGQEMQRFDTGTFLNHALFLGEGLIAATGSEGLVLYELGSPVPHLLSYPRKQGGKPVTVGIGASSDGSVVCAGDEDGRIACFANRELGGVNYPETPPPAG